METSIACLGIWRDDEMSCEDSPSKNKMQKDFFLQIVLQSKDGEAKI
jgi:hypothetical protein